MNLNIKQNQIAEARSPPQRHDKFDPMNLVKWDSGQLFQGGFLTDYSLHTTDQVTDMKITQQVKQKIVTGSNVKIDDSSNLEHNKFDRSK